MEKFIRNLLVCLGMWQRDQTEDAMETIIVSWLSKKKKNLLISAFADLINGNS